jgi:hypothetical protein
LFLCYGFRPIVPGACGPKRDLPAPFGKPD